MEKIKTHNRTAFAVFLLFVFALSFFTPQTAYAAGTKENQETLYESAKRAIEEEKGNVFEKILANVVVSIAMALRNFGYNILDFSSLDELIFNKGNANPDTLFAEDWNRTMTVWFERMRILAFPLLLVAVIITGLRFVRAASNPRAREDAIAAIQRLFFSMFIILFVPIFVNTLLQLNNYLVSGIRNLIGPSSLDDSIGMSENLIGEIKTGSALLTAIVIIMFAGIEFRLNIMFFMRMFTVTVLYIFTPFVAMMWAMEKSVNAAGIWIGEMISNIFMQFAYAFVFMVFLAFAPLMGTGGTIITVMILVSVAEMIRNSAQALWTRISGLDESRTSIGILGTLGAIGGIATLGKTIGAQLGSFSAAKKIASGLTGKSGGDDGSGGGIAGISTSGGDDGGSGGGGGTAASVSATIASARPGKKRATGTHMPLKGGSINDAQINAITGLGALQTVSNIAQTATHGITTVATLPLGQAGRRIASTTGDLTGAAVRAIGTPVTMAGSALATSIKRGEGIKGTGKAYKESLGVNNKGVRSAAQAAWRSASVTGKNAFGGIRSTVDTIQQYSIDPLDKIRY